MAQHLIEVRISFEYGHRLLYHKGKCFNVHGHSGLATFRFRSRALDPNGFVVDFNIIKPPLKEWIDVHWDHAFLHHPKDPLLPALRDHEMKLYEMPEDPTSEVMSRMLYQEAERIAPNGIFVHSVTLQETLTGGATYGEI